MAGQSGRVFEELSAVTSGVKDVRDVLTRAHERLVSRGQETVLFIDEVHRFSKSQQDALLPAVENRDVTFIGATTENPSFSIIKPLLSRSVVVKLESLEPDQLIELVQRALTDDRGLRGEVKATDEAIADIVRMAGGDARKSLTILEAAAGAVTGDEARKKGARRPIITPEIVATVMDTATVRYDKDGDDHYDVISAFIKSMRGSDPDAAIHYLARMLKAGEDPRFIARRIMIAASEEVGMAAPQILQVTVAAAQAVALVGMPEARIILAEATIAVATAPKSNASYNAINQALADVDAGKIGAVPLYLRNAPTKLMKEWGNHEATSMRTIGPVPWRHRNICPKSCVAPSTTIPTIAAMNTKSASVLPRFARCCMAGNPNRNEHRGVKCNATITVGKGRQTPWRPSSSWTTIRPSAKCLVLFWKTRDSRP